MAHEVGVAEQVVELEEILELEGGDVLVVVCVQQLAVADLQVHHDLVYTGFPQNLYNLP